MINKIINHKSFSYVITILGFFVSCLFMYNFYKCLSGFIANGYRYGMMMPTMFISYFTPVIAFIFYFYNYFVKKINGTSKWIYSILLSVLCLFNLVGIIINFDVYLSNNLLGVYQAIPSIILTFPFDGIIYNLFLIFVQVVNILILTNKSKLFKDIQDKFNHQGEIKVKFIPYIFISILAILTFIFVGDFLCGLQAIRNVLYDFKYIYLLLYILVVPLANLLLIVLTPEKRNLTNKKKSTYLISGLSINILFGLLLLIFELTTPSFMVDISKPLFPITFSVSLPIEVMVLLLIQICGSLIFTYKLIKLNFFSK